jgi:DNA-binding transcriptional ArsR family regulator
LRGGTAVEARAEERFRARASVMKAMAHPTRLYIVDELARGERCVHELTEMIGADMSTVSKHLSVLKSVGIVRDEKRGSEVYYSLRMGCVLGFFDCIEAVLKGGDDATCGTDFRTSTKSAPRRGGKR